MHICRRFCKTEYIVVLRYLGRQSVFTSTARDVNVTCNIIVWLESPQISGQKICIYKLNKVCMLKGQWADQMISSETASRQTLVGQLSARCTENLSVDTGCEQRRTEIGGAMGRLTYSNGLR